MFQIPERRTIYILVGVAAALGIILFPASLITLGAGATLGYKGCTWIQHKREGIGNEDSRS